MRRRSFLGTAAAAGAGLVIGFRIDELLAQAPPKKKTPNPFDAWIRIDKAGDVTLICGKSEMGQGVHTSHHRGPSRQGAPCGPFGRRL